MTEHDITTEERRKTWTLEVNGVAVELPDDVLLVGRDFFERAAKALDFIDAKITEHNVDPVRREDRGLIFARSEARDAAAACREQALGGITALSFLDPSVREESA